MEIAKSMTLFDFKRMEVVEFSDRGLSASSFDIKQSFVEAKEDEIQDTIVEDFENKQELDLLDL